MSLQSDIEARIKAISHNLEQSLSNHNALLVRLSEAQFILSEIIKAATEGPAALIPDAVSLVESLAEDEIKKKSETAEKIH